MARRARAALATTLIAALLLPGAAAAHGPVDPAASKYQARVTNAPAGAEATVIDGDQRLWLGVDPRETLVVLDYRGAPYLRFASHGVEVNRNSSMFYLNQVPAQTPPSNVGPTTPPHWTGVSGAHAYSWHDGRLHALAATALVPGATYAGHWTIPVRVDGAAAAIGGGLFHAPDPSLVWFWPIVVVLACVVAALRVRRSELDVRLARTLALAALTGFLLTGVGQQLHGRPTVSARQVIVFALVLVFGAWGLRRLALRQHGWFTFFIIAVAAIWEGASSITVLLDGFVLLALPSFLARAAVVTCLAAGVGLLPLVLRMAERPARSLGQKPGAGDGSEEEDELDWEDERAWELDV